MTPRAEEALRLLRLARRDHGTFNYDEIIPVVTREQLASLLAAILD